MSDSPALIAVDWGSSSFRAYLLSSDGSVLDQAARPAGVLTIAGKNFSREFRAACAQWIEQRPGLPVLMCGMIGSRQGWVEVPYIEGSVGAAELAAGSIVVEDSAHTIHIVPGIEALSLDGGPDVMRGEETILLGAIAGGAPRNSLYCLPGTHSKWVSVQQGCISSFSTYMTGDLFAVLRTGSILATMISDNPAGSTALCEHSFGRGLRLAINGNNLLHNLFSIRARLLTAREDSTVVEDVLSGLLIGTELVAVSPHLKAHNGSITLLATGKFSERYRMALVSLGYQPKVQDAARACIDGLFAIARELALIVPVEATGRAQHRKTTA